MNRVIKFRAWDNHYKYMNYKVMVGVYGNWEDVKNDKNYTACSMWIEPEKVDYKCEPHWTHFEPYHEDIKLMQYTGLKDKKCVEIYESDILKDGDMKWIVKWNFHRMGFSLYPIEENGAFDEMPVNVENKIPFEVIGNVWENPELLEKEV